MKKIDASALSVGDIIIEPNGEDGEFFAPFQVVYIEDEDNDPLVWLVPNYNALTEENYEDENLLYMCETPEDIADIYELVATKQPVDPKITQAIAAGKVEQIY